MKSSKKSKNIFQWLDELTFKKPNVNTFSEEDWETFNAYMVHRFISMYQGYIEIANIAQRFHPTDKKGIYNFYCEMLPKKKMFLRYIKSKIKNNPKEIKKYISEYYKCSLDEANEYITLLGKKGVNDIFTKMGVEDKEKKSLTKKIING
jgi:hypothetical protein